MPSCAHRDHERFDMQGPARHVRPAALPALEGCGTILPFTRPRPAVDAAALIRLFLEQTRQAHVRVPAGAATGAARQARPLRRVCFSNAAISSRTMDGRDASHYLDIES